MFPLAHRKSSLSPGTSGPVPLAWANGVNSGNIDIALHSEISDLAPGRRAENDGFLWAIVDGPGDGTVFSLTASAFENGVWDAGSSTVTDQESMATGTVFGVSYIWIGDTGDNSNNRATFKIIRAIEPAITGSDGNIDPGDVITVTCQFPAGNLPSHKDVECIFCDPATGDIYIVTKRITPVKLYRLPWALTYAGTQTVEFVGNLTSDPVFNTISQEAGANDGYVTRGDMSLNGAMIVLGSYSALYCFERDIASQTILQALQQTPAVIDAYVGGGDVPFSHPTGEPKGEALCFDRAGEDLYTASESVPAQGSAATRFPLFHYDFLTDPVTTHVFQEGINGYSGTSDTYTDQDNPAANNGALTSFIVEKTGTANRQGLLKFLLPSGLTGKICVGAWIDLTITTEGSDFALYRMLADWNEASTWASFTNGIALNGVEASSTADAVLLGLNGYTGTIRVNIPSATVQAWIDAPAANRGFVMESNILSAHNDGLVFASHEHATVASRPKLTIRTTD